MTPFERSSSRARSMLDADTRRRNVRGKVEAQGVTPTYTALRFARASAHQGQRDVNIAVSRERLAEGSLCSMSIPHITSKTPSHSINTRHHVQSCFHTNVFR